MNPFTAVNSFGERPVVKVESKVISTSQNQYDDLPADAPQGKYESPSHYFDRIARKDAA